MWGWIKQNILWPASYPLRIAYCRIFRYKLDKAIILGDIPTVEYFLKLGANPNGHSKLNYLKDAIVSGDYELTKLLIKYEANTGFIDQEKNTLLHLLIKKFAEDEKTHPIASYLSRENQERILNTRNKIAELLLEKKPGLIDSQNQKGDTPLHIACTIDRKRMTELLISKGADVNKYNNEGLTPLQEIIIKHPDHMIERCKLLVKYGANIRKKSLRGEDLKKIANIYDGPNNSIRSKLVEDILKKVTGENLKKIKQSLGPKLKRSTSDTYQEKIKEKRREPKQISRSNSFG